MSYENILYEKDGHVVTITINRPEVHNCINWETAKELQIVTFYQIILGSEVAKKQKGDFSRLFSVSKS